MFRLAPGSGFARRGIAVPAQGDGFPAFIAAARKARRIEQRCPSKQCRHKVSLANPNFTAELENRPNNSDGSGCRTTNQVSLRNMHVGLKLKNETGLLSAGEPSTRRYFSEAEEMSFSPPGNTSPLINLCPSMQAIGTLY